MAEPRGRQSEYDDHAARMSSGWCHGATGIGLARLGCRGLIDDPEIEGEIEAALATVQMAPPSRFDDLCCGNFGRLDLYLSAGIGLGRPELIAHARAVGAQRVGRALEQGFAWRRGDDSLNLGLFQGISGIGYELLRLAEPKSLPSILMWD
jgi:lantibiotic modifying enzyme